MDLENFENLENANVTPEPVSDAAGVQSVGSRDLTFMEMYESMNHNLMPKIRFTTDPEEAAEAARADRSNPLNLPDSVFYVKPLNDSSKEEQSDPLPKSSGFQNPSFGIHVDNSDFVSDVSSDMSGNYVGPSLESINRRIDSAKKQLAFAQEQLDRAMTENTGVLSATHLVESAQAQLDAVIRLYEEALKFNAPD